MEQDFELLMSLMTEPALCVREGKIKSFNAAAAAALPKLRAGARASAFLPQHILSGESDGWSAAAMVGGRVCDITAARSGGALIIVLRTPPAESGEGEDIELLSALQSTLGNCHMAIEIMFNNIDEQALSPGVRKYASILLHNHYLMQRSVGHLMLERADMPPQTGACCNLPEICSDVVTTVSLLLRETRVMPDFSTELGTLLVRLDGELAERVLLALIAESVKRMPQGGALKISLTADEAARLTLRGEPCGESDESDGEGTAFAKAAVVRSGGTVLTETLPAGFAVTLSLPLADGAEAPMKEPCKPSARSMAPVLTELSPVLGSESYLLEYL